MSLISTENTNKISICVTILINFGKVIAFFSFCFFFLGKHLLAF